MPTRLTPRREDSDRTPPLRTDARRASDVYRNIRDRIVRGELADGTHMVETSLAESMGVSRSPVREALARLASDGFLLAARGSRRVELVVAPLKSDDLEELWTLVGAIESAAVSRLDRLSPVARRALASELMHVNDALKRLVRTEPLDAGRYRDLQGAFHETLVAACGGPRIRAAHAAIRPHVARYETARAAESRATSVLSLSEHDTIIDAIERGAPAAAREAVSRHWANAAGRSAAVISKRSPS